MNKEITIIGAGNMGQAVARGLIEREVVTSANLVLSNPNLAKLTEFKNAGVILESNNSKAVYGSEVLILAVKPQIMCDVLEEIRETVTDNQLIISLAAGISLNTIRKGLLNNQPIVHVMPNLAAQTGQSMSVWTKNEYIKQQHVKQVKTILESIGQQVEVDTEDEIDKATAISGSGPAYVFYMLELLQESAKQLGFNDEIAAKLARQTLIGSVDVIASSDYSATELRTQVTSKGGTTEAAFNEFEKNKLGKRFIKGVNAAYKRAIELGKKF